MENERNLMTTTEAAMKKTAAATAASRPKRSVRALVK